MKITSEVTGSVWKVLKAAGDTVNPGEEVALIESMKMEIPVICEDGGRVQQIHVSEGDPVAEGQLIATVER
ncbi:MAG: biotin/lipoyl-binding carrier protein [Burkholderiaceae bacterium]